ncbi:MAG: hypothetical protein KDM63_20215 [Verrucomicrobiae bacterium]|nr:hypothetical protein [Verrucomicrobiae bacterium]
MTRAELKKRIDDGCPLTLHVADGRKFEIPHEDFIWLPPNSTIVVVAEPNPENAEETLTNIIPLLMVSGVTQTQAADQVG